ncbi:MAG: hypothetical protein P0S95_01610 [Rhabdochlamydiaceae bacterium]|nr:hypothetical protein [Candidatus Amphrikana amoebophyrae]
MTKARKTVSKAPLKDFLNLKIDTLDHSFPKERHSTLFLKQGENLLAKGDPSGIDFFEYAETLDQLNFEMFTQIGLSLTDLAEEKNEIKYYLLANKKFKAALKLNAQHFPAWHQLALNLFNLGEKTGEHHYYLDAKEKFQKALEHSDLIDKDLTYDLYTQIGSNMFEIALHSEEMSDFSIAIETYNQAKEMYPSHTSEFWYEFGRICLQFSHHIDDDRLLMQAIDCFGAATKIKPQDFDQWYCLGISLKTLYESTHDEDHFSRANECFSFAAKMDPTHGEMWQEWAQLLMYSGRRLKDIKRLTSAVEKCSLSASLIEDCSIINSIWSESLTVLGVLHDNIDYFHQAENRVIEALGKHGPLPCLLHAHGFCLFGLGKYFNDLDYYYQAIEKFQEGLSLDRTSHELWYAIGHTYAIVANIEKNEEMFNQALSFFKKAIHLKPLSLYLYETGLSFYKLSELDSSKVSIQMALFHYEQAISKQKSTVYLHPDWLFQYAVALDSYADQTEDDTFYVKAIEILSHVLVTDPDHPDIHHKLGLVYTHLAELTLEKETYVKALFHYQLAYQKGEENDVLLLDWGLSLINYSECLELAEESEAILMEAEYKMIQSAKLGNVHAYYHLSCLYSIKSEIDKGMIFLAKAQEFDSLPTLDEMLDDTWLENLRSTSQFEQFLSTIETKVEEEL